MLMLNSNGSGNHPKHVVIVGGGFGGIAVARRLAKRRDLMVTVISDLTTFRYYPALFRLAVGFSRRQGLIPLKSIIKEGPRLQIVHAEIKDINPDTKVISTSKNLHFKFDYAVLALGVTTSYFGIHGLEDFSYSIKSPDKLRAFHNHLHEMVTSKNDHESNYVIVGGGPTGVELAASLGEYLKTVARRHHIKLHKVRLEIIEAAPRLLPAFDPKASEMAAKRLKKLGIKILTGSKVQGETKKSLMVDGRSLPTHTVVWTAGVTNNEFYRKHSSIFTFSKRGKVIVDRHLQARPDLYVIGDNAETSHSGLAEVAIAHAKYASKDIIRQSRGLPRLGYHEHQPTYVVPVGTRFAIMQSGHFVMGGWIASKIRDVADLIGYADIMGWRQAWKTSRKREQQEENSCRICKAALAAEIPDH